MFSFVVLDCSKDDIIIKLFIVQLVTKIHLFIFHWNHFNSSTGFVYNLNYVRY